MRPALQKENNGTRINCKVSLKRFGEKLEASQDEAASAPQPSALTCGELLHGFLSRIWTDVQAFDGE